MRRFACLCCTVLLLGCGGSDSEPDAAADAPPPPPPAPAPVSLSALAGTWTVQVMPMNSDSVILTYTLNATDTTAWTIKFPDRADLVPVRVVAVAGDSVVTQSGPYPSALRKNVTVTTDGVLRLENGVLMGTNTAHYSAGPDTVLVLRSRGTRSQ